MILNIQECVLKHFGVVQSASEYELADEVMVMRESEVEEGE